MPYTAKIKQQLHKEARRAAARVGMRAHRSDVPRGPDNQGGYMLVDALADVVILGHGFVLTAGEVIDYCSGLFS